MSSLSQEVSKWELDTPSAVMDGDVRHPGNGSTQAQVVSFPTGVAFRVQRGGHFFWTASHQEGCHSGWEPSPFPSPEFWCFGLAGIPTYEALEPGWLNPGKHGLVESESE